MQQQRQSKTQKEGKKGGGEHEQHSTAVTYRRVPYLVLFGATVGAFLDYLHTHGGAIDYPPDTNHWRGILTFAATYSIGGILYAWWHNALGNTKPPASYARAFATVPFFAAMYAYTAYSTHDSVWIAAVLYATWVVLWFLHDRTWQGFVGGLVTGLIGAGIESALSHWGTMAYATQDILKVPHWLSPIYIMCSATWGHVCRRALTGP